MANQEVQSAEPQSALERFQNLARIARLYLKFALDPDLIGKVRTFECKGLSHKEAIAKAEKIRDQRRSKGACIEPL